MGRFFRRASATPATAGAVVGLPGSSDRQTILFVCLHGSAKSQMAAAHFNRMARDRGLPHTAISRAIEPDKDIPSSIRAGLAGEGLEPVSEVPASLTADEASRAMKVFAFNEVPLDRKGAAIVTLWSDVSPATEDYNRARDAIVRHVEAVFERPSIDGKVIDRITYVSMPPVSTTSVGVAYPGRPRPAANPEMSRSLAGPPWPLDR